uniref:Lysosomal protein NCU-G1 n=1 Tax=Timema cristinae TaxID=61476 RepID=A0A7R9D6M4_TIMCR|nr:unnamed protein product [Timema cristinae]
MRISWTDVLTVPKRVSSTAIASCCSALTISDSACAAVRAPSWAVRRAVISSRIKFNITVKPCKSNTAAAGNICCGTASPSSGITKILMVNDATPSSYLTRALLSSSVNPGCNPGASYCDKVTLVHVRAEGPNDTLHYLWGFTGKPSIILALTSPNATLTINWKDFIFASVQAIEFSEKPIYSFGLVVNKIWEYNDVNDTGYLNMSYVNKNYKRAYDTEYFHWKIAKFENDTEGAILHMESAKYNKPGDVTAVEKGNIKFMVSAYGYNDHSDILPHLVHTQNSSLIDLVIDKLGTNSHFSHARFAVDIILASQDPKNTTMTFESHKSLDDEYTPGVFTMVDLQTPSSLSGAKGGYIQWRPVAYIAKERDLTNSTDANNYGLSNVTYPSAVLNSSALYAFFSSSLENMLVQETVVSFGLKEDGTFLVGYGHPPDEKFSLLVILVISIGLGLPALLILVSGIVMAVRRVSHKNDDLFLSR